LKITPVNSSWDENIKMNIKEIGCGDWSGLIWISIESSDRTLVNTITKLLFLNGRGFLRFSRSDLLHEAC
jgi:hypothetical protein